MTLHTKDVSPKRRLGPRGLEAFTARSAAALRCCASATDALGALAADRRAKRLARLAADLQRATATGATLSEALAGHPEIFSPAYVRAVAAGEESGDLPAVLDLLCDNVRQADRVTRQRKKGMRLLLAVAVGALLVFGAVVMRVASPSGRTVCETVVLGGFPGLGAWLRPYGAVLFWGAIIVLAVAWLARFSKRTAYLWDQAKRAILVVRPLTVHASLARFSHTLSLLISSGVPPGESLDLAATDCGSPVLRGRLASSKGDAAAGASISERLTRADKHGRLFGRSYLWMLAEGERSGHPARVLNALAGEHEQELARKTALVWGYVSAVAVPMVCLIYMVTIGVPYFASAGGG